ncbi:hypothetical protein EI555_020191 [Monodon monoceros]|uniref:polynucleotide adenylyltransferase n=1 Tax=Monodon monoceros TaxID=40151 RepID=A0A4U1EG31_MONMO|nr:hypothetical protein EI555_020191 [Monodon monoceros]
MFIHNSKISSMFNYYISVNENYNQIIKFSNLTWDQVITLHQVLDEVIPIHGRGNFPTLEVKPKDIIHVVKDQLIEQGIIVKDTRLNGSTASYILASYNGMSYKDLDVILGIELLSDQEFQLVKDVVLGCLLDFLPKGVKKEKITLKTMKEAYVQKMVKVCNKHDRWSLISLSNNTGKNVELKFVNSLRRQFEFSVDSFQIILDPMLDFYSDKSGTLTKELCPVVVAESMYGDFQEAMTHLQHKLISTRKPEEIRGGGLLKYSNLLVHNFKPVCEAEIKTLERYMCSRFFIDFPDIEEQRKKIESYLYNHFIGEEKRKYDYLMTLHGVVNESTVLPMGHKRRQTLNMITLMALKVLGEQNILPNTGKALLALLIIHRVDGGNCFKPGQTTADEDQETDRAQGLDMEDGDCRKVNSDYRVEDFVDFKLGDIGCGVIQCPVGCATEDLGNCKLKILMTVYLNILIIGQMNVLLTGQLNVLMMELKILMFVDLKILMVVELNFVVFVELKILVMVQLKMFMLVEPHILVVVEVKILVLMELKILVILQQKVLILQMKVSQLEKLKILVILQLKQSQLDLQLQPLIEI